MDTAEPGIDGARTETSCIACNQRNGEAYQLRLHRRDGTHADVEPTLCDACIKSHLESEWIELLIPIEK